jgi:hypothetical protein
MQDHDELLERVTRIDKAIHTMLQELVSIQEIVNELDAVLYVDLETVPINAQVN